MNLSEQLAGHGIRLRSYAEGNHKTPCPTCSNTRRNKSDPCLSVKIDDRGATWNCHHCGAKGAVSDEPAREDARPLFKQQTPRSLLSKIPAGPLPDFVRAWFKTERGIGDETLMAASVSWGRWWYSHDQGEQDCIVFPYHDTTETIVNAKFRTMSKEFRQVPNAIKTLYRIHACDPSLKQIVICEGEIDALSCLEAGIPNAVSVPDGAPKKVKDEQAGEDRKFSYLANCEEQLKAYQKIILAADNDDPGRALNEELARRLGRDRCYLVEWPQGYKDANEVLAGDRKKGLPELGPDDLAACITAAKPYPIRSVFTSETYLPSVMRLYNEGRKPGLSTGWPSVDELLTIVPGQLTVVTGIPNSGKSEWLDALAMNLAQLHDWRFGVCSFENQGDDHLIKLIEKHADAPFWPGPRMRMGPEEIARSEGWIRDRFFFIRAENESPTIEWALECGRACLLRHGVRGLILDPYNRFEHKRPSGMSETEYVSDMLSRVQRFSAANGIHTFFVAHPAKMQREKDGGAIPIPGLYDISGSAHWANICDNGVTVHRDDAKHITEIHVKKVASSMWASRVLHRSGTTPRPAHTES
jgi:twinkle protein